MNGAPQIARVLANRAPEHFGPWWTAVAAVGLGLFAVGGFDTDKSPWLERAEFWILATVLCATVVAAARRLAEPLAAGRSPWLVAPASVAVLWAPLTLLLMGCCVLLYGGRPSLERFVALLPGTGVLVAALQIATELLAPRPARRPAPTAEPTLQALLPPPLRRARLYALEAEDHYVRVHTSAGCALLRMRLGDAIAQAGGGGVQTHRSWWVSVEAVAGVRRRRGGAVLTLVNGLEAPVSRTASRSLLTEDGALAAAFYREPPRGG